MSVGVQVFVYPEELRFVGPHELAELVAGLGCDAVSMSLVYHRARRVFPRHGHVSVLRGTTAYFRPDAARYGALRPDEVADPELCGAVVRFREACRSAGLIFRAWVVGLHHESLAARHPDAAAQGPDGAALGHSLCPSAPASVEYLSALAGDVAAQLAPDAVDLEAWLYPAWEPSYTLTLALEPLSPEQELLATQCFCRHCLSLLGPAAETRRLEEIAAARAAGAAALARAVVDAVHAEGAELRLFGSGPPAQVHLQGLSPQALDVADGALLGCARLAGGELLARFRALLEASGLAHAMVSTNWTPQRSPDAMAADVGRLATAGADGLALYNLSLVPDEGLDAFRAAAAAFRAAVPG